MLTVPGVRMTFSSAVDVYLNERFPTSDERVILCEDRRLLYTLKLINLSEGWILYRATRSTTKGC